MNPHIYNSRRKAILTGTKISYREIARRMLTMAKVLAKAELLVYLSLLERLGSKDVCWPSQKAIMNPTTNQSLRASLRKSTIRSSCCFSST